MVWIRPYQTYDRRQNVMNSDIPEVRCNVGIGINTYVLYRIKSGVTCIHIRVYNTWSAWRIHIVNTSNSRFHKACVQRQTQVNTTINCSHPHCRRIEICAVWIYHHDKRLFLIGFISGSVYAAVC